MRNGFDSVCFGKVHCKVFEFRKIPVVVGLWFKDETTPKSYYGKTFWLAFKSFDNIE